MANPVTDVLLPRLQAFNQMRSGQKLGLLFGLAAMIALVAGVWMWSTTPDYKVVYSNLSDRDGGDVIAALGQMNVPYKIADGGTAILVPSSEVYDVRLKLASRGLPKGSVVGFELMETPKLGLSQFQEQVNYQRALEGELTRSIQSLSAIRDARVHLAIPRPSVFVSDQQKPSAAVLVNLYPGRSLDAAQVAGIARLVASSVPELSEKNVTVVDQGGNLLSKRAGDSVAGLDAGQLDYLRQVEQSYASRIENILSPITGQGNVRAQVSADLDFSQAVQTAEQYKPNGTPASSSIRSQQSVDTATSGAPDATGIPGASSNQPPVPLPPLNAKAPAGQAAKAVAKANSSLPPEPAPAPANLNTRHENTINYEVDKTVRRVEDPPGMVKRLSVAVVVNDKKTINKDGSVKYVPLTQAEMAQINNLVKEAMGFNATRGDTMNVVNAAFEGQDTGPQPKIPFYKDPANFELAKTVAKDLFIGVMALVVLLTIRRTLADLARAPEPAPAAEANSLLALADQADEPAPRLGTNQYENQLTSAKDLARENPAIVAHVVKDWLGDE